MIMRGKDEQLYAHNEGIGFIDMSGKMLRSWCTVFAEGHKGVHCVFARGLLYDGCLLLVALCYDSTDARSTLQAQRQERCTGEHFRVALLQYVIRGNLLQDTSLLFCINDFTVHALYFHREQYKQTQNWFQKYVFFVQHSTKT